MHQNHIIIGFMNYIGTSIKNRRKEFNITQRELANMADVNINTLTQIEKGEGNPTVRSVQKILKILGMELTTKIAEL